MPAGGQPQASSSSPPEGKCALCALDDSVPSTRALQFVLEKLPVCAEQGEKLILFVAAKMVNREMLFCSFNTISEKLDGTALIKKKNL